MKRILITVDGLTMLIVTSKGDTPSRDEVIDHYPRGFSEARVVLAIGGDGYVDVLKQNVGSMEFS